MSIRQRSVRTAAGRAPRLLLLACVVVALGSATLRRVDSAPGGSALRFDGRDDYVAFDPAGELALRTFTIEAWFQRLGTGRPVRLGAGGVEAIPLIGRGPVRGSGRDGGLNYFLGLRAGDGVLVAAFQEQAGGGHRLIAGTTPVGERSWSHAAATFDGSVFRIYLNGRLEAERVAPGMARAGGAEQVGLGTTLDARGTRAGFFHGDLDEIRIWDGGRSGEEIAAAMSRPIETAPGLLARWGLDEGSGSVTIDAEGRHPSRTLFGAVWAAGSPLSVTVAEAGIEACIPTPSPLQSVIEAGTGMKYQVNTTAPPDLTLVEAGSPMSYLVNTGDPGTVVSESWMTTGFDAGTWDTGTYGVGYETAPPGASSLIQTSVSDDAFSVFTRTTFTLDDVTTVGQILLAADYDDGYAAWINGHEVFRSAQLPATGPLAWNTNAATHESSNGSTPDYGTPADITVAAAPWLVSGDNILAIGVWNNGAPASTDLVLVPRLSLGFNWAAEGYDDSTWATGLYGVGYDTGAAPNALALLETAVPAGAFSVFTRATFEVVNAGGVFELLLGADYDDGIVAWINGTEVYRSGEIPGTGVPPWNLNAGLHESSNGTVPDYGTPVDLSSFIPLLHDGANVLAVGVWNSGAPASTDLVLVPRLQMRSTLDLCDGIDNDCDVEIDEDHVIVPTACGVGICSGNTGAIVCAGGAPVDTCDPFEGAASETVLVEYNSAMRYQANATPAGMDWTAAGFDDSTWSTGTYGVGYETRTAPDPNAHNLLQTDTVAPGTASVFTRATFEIADPGSVDSLFLGVDYDDGFVAWLNGTEILGSDEMPGGPLTGTSAAGLHESSNGLLPNYTPIHDVSQYAGLIVPGTNVLAIGVWNRDTPAVSTDLVLVPRLSINENDACNGVDDDCDGSTDEGHRNSDGDGMADCVDTDDDNDSITDDLDCWPLDPGRAAEPPSEVQDFAWTVGQRPARRLAWTDQGSGILYDVAGGMLADLRSDGGVDDAVCLSDGQSGSSFVDGRPDPPLGSGYYYIVRAEKAVCAAGSYGLATSGEERLPIAACP